MYEGEEIELQDKRAWKPGMWDDECEQAFIEIKKKLISFPVLRTFDPRLKTEIVTDASATHVGGALLQRTEKDEAVVIAYYSRSLIDAERSYSAQEREMLGVVACAQAWRHFLLGANCQVRVLTDHRSLTHVKLSKVAANRVGRSWIPQLGVRPCPLTLTSSGTA